jgi:3-deoxy-7-phosphoheptulonate synthase
MIVITQPNATEEQIQRTSRVREFGLEAQSAARFARDHRCNRARSAPSRKADCGNGRRGSQQPRVEVTNRARFRGASSVVVGNVRLGEHDVVLICGPCSVESREQIQSIASIVKESGAKILRGAF